MELLRNLDLLALLLALPVFILAGLPISGYLAVAAAWIAARIGLEVAARRRTEALLAGNRRAALALTAWSTMGRLWLIAGAILLVGLLDQREAGLAAAVLAFVLVTVSFLSQYVSHMQPDAEVPR